VVVKLKVLSFGIKNPESLISGQLVIWTRIWVLLEIHVDCMIEYVTFGFCNSQLKFDAIR
jgi:hypothetical protein